MTPGQIAEQVRTLGGRLVLAGCDRIQVEPGPNGVPRWLVDEVRAHKPAILVELQKRETVLEAARLLRECQWAKVPPVCDFLIGPAGESCRRCGASWIEHYPAPRDGAPR